MLPIYNVSRQSHLSATNAGTSSIFVFLISRCLMLLEISGNVLNRKQPSMQTFSRDAKLMLVGITRSFLQPSIHNTFSLCRFLIDEGSSTRLEQWPSDSLSRLVASERFGISFNLEEKVKSIFLRFARDYMY